MGLLMIDLDNFKIINDSYGHLFGDKVLQKFAALLEESIRSQDTAFRYGGDEFVVVVRDIDPGGLSHVRQRIQSAADDWIAGNDRFHNIGISIGSSWLKPGQSANIDSMLKRADKSMYAIKQGKKARKVHQ